MRILSSVWRAAFRAASAFIAWSRTQSGLTFWGSLAAAFFLVAFSHQFTARFGSGLPAIVGSLAAVASAIVVASLVPMRRNSESRWPSVVCGSMLILWAIANGLFADWITQFVGRIELETLLLP